MDNAAHTPGPYWQGKIDACRRWLLSGNDFANKRVAEFEREEDAAYVAEVFKNHALMLAALRKIEAYLERWADEPECGEFYGIAHDAIAKAQGETP